MALKKLREDLDGWTDKIGLEEIAFALILVVAVLVAVLSPNLTCGISIDSRPSVTTTTTPP